jgi:hypothetical protein
MRARKPKNMKTTVQNRPNDSASTLKNVVNHEYFLYFLESIEEELEYVDHKKETSSSNR